VRRQRYSARAAAKALGLTTEILRRRSRTGRLGRRRGRGGWTYSAREIESLRRQGAKWMTTGQAARVLKRSTKTVNGWADSGLLVHRRGRGGWRWFARASVLFVARVLDGRCRLNRRDRAALLSEVASG
jgi:hypothetical protein